MSASSDCVVGDFVLVVVGFGVVLAMTGTISHRLPLYPVGHSHKNKPSSVGFDVHFPPFKHVLGFSSQYFSSENGSQHEFVSMTRICLDSIQKAYSLELPSSHNIPP